MTESVILTKEHRRFTEFANAVKKERTIGICHGDTGVGTTNSARGYANWDTLEPYITAWVPRGTTRWVEMLGRDEILVVLDRHWNHLGRTLNPTTSSKPPPAS